MYKITILFIEAMLQDKNDPVLIIQDKHSYYLSFLKKYVLYP